MACFSTMPNVYAVLTEPEKDLGTNDLERKALKKLREIQKLKAKSPESLSDTERNKMQEEDIWKTVVTPPNPLGKQTLEEEAERKRKQREKTKADRLERERQEERQGYKDTIERLVRERWGRNANLASSKRRNAVLQSELADLRRSNAERDSVARDASGNEVEESMHTEFKKHWSELGTPKAAWHKMMLKYHPDKFTENTELADIFSKIVNGLKEKYVEG
jgi:hypothetical protein